MVVVKRFFRPTSQIGDIESPDASPLSEFLDCRVIVILGNPGMGKTTELIAACEADPDHAVFATVSEFLTNPIELYIEKTIYIDALDEHRADTRQGKTVVNTIKGRLLSLGSPKVRLSCRSEEWHAGSDVSSLNDAGKGEDVCILQMEPLRREDIEIIAAEKIDDVDRFIEGAIDRDLYESLGNPENLFLYLEVFKKDGGWPRSRAELMKRSVEILFEERNEEHARSIVANVSDGRLLRAAEDISAIITFSTAEGVSLTKPSASDFYPALGEFSGIDLEASQAIVRRRLFTSNTPETVRPQHKSTGDYLAAQAIVRRIKSHQLTLSRALTLITGEDGGPLSHARDVFAWLIALLPHRGGELIKRDPFGALVYGDASQWPIELRRLCLGHLRAFAHSRDPWFRAGTWYAPLLGGFSDEALITDFRNILEEEENLHVVSVVLTAMEHGPQLEELGGDLIAFIYDTTNPKRQWLKDNALRAFRNVCPERTDTRKKLLSDIQNGIVHDGDQTLRSELLREFYPSEIGPGDVVQYFANSEVIGSGTIDWFVRHEMVVSTPPKDIPVLFEATLANPDGMKKLGQFNRRSLNGKLIRRLLNDHGQTSTPAQLYRWMGIYMDRHNTAHVDSDDVKEIREYIEDYPALYVALFRHWFDHEIPCDDNNIGYHHYAFDARMLGAQAPSDFPTTLLSWAATEHQEKRREFLFETAVSYVFRHEAGHYEVNIDYLERFCRDYPQFTAVWDKNRVTQIPDWRHENAVRASERDRERMVRRGRDIEILSSQIQVLKTGANVVNLDFAANKYFKAVSNGLDPFVKLKQDLNGEISDAIFQGFQTLLHKDTPHSPSQIAHLRHEDKRYFEAYPVLAAADIMATKSRANFLSLPDANLQSALAYHWIYLLGSQDRTWPKLLARHRPEIVRTVLAEIWRTQLDDGKKDRLDAAFLDRAEDVFAPCILTESSVLLSERPNLPPRILQDFLISILRYGDPKVLRAVYGDALSNNSIRGEARVLWLATATLLDPRAHRDQLERKMASKARFVWSAYAILTAGAQTLMSGDKSIPELHVAVSILGRHFNNIPMSIGEREGWLRADEDAARTIRELIQRLAGLPDRDAGEALIDLLAQKELHEWHDNLRHARVEFERNYRDTQYTFSTASDIGALLYNGPPANLRDLKALALDIFEDLANQIRGGNDNKWRSFWNHAAYGKLGRPKIENHCRDALIPWMLPYLQPRGITIEPEASAADEKRVDIRLTHASVGTLPVELKRNDNAELWTAMSVQLPQYTNDASTGGYAIYLALWFGKDGNRCTSSPAGVAKPSTSIELKASLEALVTEPKVAVMVLDVSKPNTD